MKILHHDKEKIHGLQQTTFQSGPPKLCNLVLTTQFTPIVITSQAKPPMLIGRTIRLPLANHLHTIPSKKMIMDKFSAMAALTIGIELLYTPRRCLPFLPFLPIFSVFYHRENGRLSHFSFAFH